MMFLFCILPVAVLQLTLGRRRCAGLLLVLLLLLFPVAATFAQVPAGVAPAPQETGLPLLRNFSPKEYGAQPQNWVSVQDARGVLYVGNSNGVLEFDGKRWRLIKLPNQALVRSLAIDPSGRVYVGALGEIGYLQADAHGQTGYVSLLDLVPPDARNFGDIRQTFVTPDGIVFSGFDQLLRLQGKKFTIWKPATTFHFAFHVGNRVFTRELGRGLLELVGGELRLVPGGERFTDEKIYAMLPVPPATAGAPELILVGTRTQGFFLFDGKVFTPWATDIDADLKRDLLYSAARLPDGRLAFGTAQGGLYLTDAYGHRLAHLGKAEGLLDDAVISMFFDREGGGWLGLGRGITRAELSNPLSIFDDRNGLVGAIFAVHRHLGRLYVGTAQGLYVLETGADPHFRRIPGIESQTWAFLSVGESLLAANYQGVYAVTGDTVTLVHKSGGSFALLASAAQPGRVFVGQEGLASIRKVEGGWLDEGVLPGITDQIRSLYEDRNGDLWLGSRGTGVLRLRFSAASPDGGLGAAKIERFGPDDGLPSMSTNAATGIGGELRFATTAGIYRFVEDRRRFEPDPRFAELFVEPRAITAFDEVADGLWLATENAAGEFKESGLAALQADGRYRWEARALGALVGSNIISIHRDPDGKVWLGGEDGLYLYDARIKKDYTKSYAAIVRQVSGKNAGVIYAGNGALPAPPKLAFADNNLRFQYSAPSFDDAAGVRFQVRLEGNDADWSEWNTEDYKDYSNLFEGNYRFRVRAKNLYGTLSREAVFSFTVRPPWYRTVTAYLAYLVILAGLAWAGLRWRLKRLQVQRQVLQRMVDEQTAELTTAKQSAEATLAYLQSAKAQLVQSEKMASLGQLVAGVSHEVNTPLGIALTASSHLEDSSKALKKDLAKGPLSEQALAGYVDLASESSAMIQRNVLRAAGLVQSLKQVSVDRSSDGHRSFDVKEFLDDLLRSTASMWKNRPVAVSVNCASGITIDSFPGALGQVVTNFIQNALLHAFEPGESGHIRISASLSGRNHVVLRCEDDGCGVAPELLGQVFEPFFTTKRNQGGTGLGLYIAFNLTTQKLGGTIDVESTLGKGTCFRLTLPLVVPN